MAQVRTPTKKPDLFSQILPVAGAVGGGIYGGPQGAMAGANAGSAAGGMLGSVTGKPQQETLASEQGGSAMQRRMAQIESDPVYTLNQAKMALQSLPPDVQQQYQKPIDDAYERAIAQAKQNQQMGRTA